MLWMYSATATESAATSVIGGRVLGDGGANQFALLVVERGARAQQVRILAVGGTAQVHRVAAGAVGLIQRLAAHQHVGRRERAGELREPAAAATAARRACPGPAPR